MYAATARCSGVLSSLCPATSGPQSACAAAARRLFTSFVSVFFARRFGSAPLAMSILTIAASMRAAAACTAPYPSLRPTTPDETKFGSAPPSSKISQHSSADGESDSAAATRAVRPAHLATASTSAPAAITSLRQCAWPFAAAAVSGVSHVPSPPPVASEPCRSRSLTRSTSPLLHARVRGSSLGILWPCAHFPSSGSCGMRASALPAAVPRSSSICAHSR
mmetsp:Transcript_4024/g.17862  ORF Transcript_4024/g.17862 Transcript_4024/m.17862 type:complete len:221 (-) Transcript_4024:290-952(-)